MFQKLVDSGFQVEFHSHAEAILDHDFPEAAVELEGVLFDATIPVEEIIAGGGGETQGTQRLRRSLHDLGWQKHTFVIEKTIDGVPRESISHEIDHVKAFRNDGEPIGVIALEIEWNNKDPFYDRDLENFKRLHADGAISVGVIVTRGRSLQSSMRSLVARFMEEKGVVDFEGLVEWRVSPTARQRRDILKRVNREKSPLSFQQAFVEQFVSDKYGEATTHWRKLEDRIRRGVGNPCPLVLIGLPDSIVRFGEPRAEVEQLLDQAEAESRSDNDRLGT